MKIGIFANIDKTMVKDTLPPLIEWLYKKEQKVVISHKIIELFKLNKKYCQVVDLQDLPRVSDLMVAMGGDGTMLAVARLVGKWQKPIIGINLGGLGFLTEIAVEELYQKMDKIIQGEYKIEKRMVLTARVFRNHEHHNYFALNDMVLERGGSSRVIDVDVTVNGEYFNTYISDGIIVSTPTGSTAYSLSSWGPIVDPSLESIILNSICPHALTVRPTVFPESSNIVLKVKSQDSEAILSVDGQQTVNIVSGTSVEVKKGDFYINLVTLPGHSFFKLLRHKLQWGHLPHK
jgi:NAD+ kinase